MEPIYEFKTIEDYAKLFDYQVKNSSVAILDFSTIKDNAILPLKFSYDYYVVFLKDVKCGDLKYGKSYYDYDEGTLVFLAPKQVLEIENPRFVKHRGYALVFKKDFIRKFGSLNIEDYTFFSYNVNEALHIDQAERIKVLECFENIQSEIDHQDNYSNRLIASNIELFLSYCMRFYERQFENRKLINNDIANKFNDLLIAYYTSPVISQEGIPSVKYFADKLFLSSNYFGDLIKRTTGQSPQEHIQDSIISFAKERLAKGQQSISQIAYDLGFEYPQYFTRLFKKRVGMTPHEYRSQMV